MTDTLPPLDPHDRYIATVSAALDDARHYVKDWTSCTDEVAEALIELNDGTALRWTECEGWSCLTSRGPGGHYDNIDALQIGIVPAPAHVVGTYRRVRAGYLPVTSGAHGYRDPAAVDQELPEDAEMAAQVAAELAKY